MVLAADAGAAAARSALRALCGRDSGAPGQHASTNHRCAHGDTQMATMTATALDIGAVEAQRYSICLIHPFDPRGQKVGGLETYIRDFITFHPADTEVLVVGVDSVGGLELGKV